MSNLKEKLFLLVIWFLSFVWAFRWFIIYYGVMLIASIFLTIPNILWYIPLLFWAFFSMLLITIAVVGMELGNVFEILTGIQVKNNISINIMDKDITVDQRFNDKNNTQE